MALKNKKYGLKFRNQKPTWIRSLNEMEDVVYDKEWLKAADNFNVYYVWRGVKLPRDRFGPTLRGKKENDNDTSDIRYDITIIPHRLLGKEFPKTKGHRHLDHFQELIQVLEGEAFYLAQKGDGKNVKDCYAVKAKKGDFVIIPSDVWHLTINPGRKKLVMANWMFKKAGSDYSLFEKFQGACYYYTKSGWLKNKNYGIIPKLAFKKPLNKMPENLDFLK